MNLIWTSLLLTGCPSAPASDSQDSGAGDGDEALIEDLTAQLAELQDQVDALQTQVDTLQSQLSELEAPNGTNTWDDTGDDTAGPEDYLTAEDLDAVLTEYVRADGIPQVMSLESYLEVSADANEVHLIGANVFIQSGSGATNGDPSDPSRGTSSSTVNGLGNLFIGYNERSAGSPEEQLGSHNLIVGPYHSFTSYGGIIAGYGSSATEQYASVVGGLNNAASAPFASVSGGFANVADGDYAAVHGGRSNTASGYAAAVGGGYMNTVLGDYASVLSGSENYVSGDYGAIVGGSGGVVSGSYSSILGGDSNGIDSKAMYATICGGREERGTASYSTTCN